MAVSDPNMTDTGARMLMVHMAENTSLHGVPNVYRSHGKIRRLIWCLLFLAGLVLCIYQLAENFKKFVSRPTTTKVGVIRKDMLPFPAVTICNKNPIRLSVVADMPDGFEDLFQDEVEESNDGNLTYFEWSDVNYSSSTLAKISNFYLMYSQLNDTMKKVYGHQLDTMLLTCEYNGYPCSPDNFTSILNSQYGNCYTFNHNIEDAEYAYNIGPLYGLNMELYIEQEEYIDDLSDVAGLQVLIHNQTYMPLPEKQGFSVAPGYATYIGLDRYEETRAEPPYGDCEQMNSEKNAQLNAYTSYYGYIGYSYEACRFTCYQRTVIEYCSCGDAGYPLSSTAFPSLDGSEAVPCISSTQNSCRENVSDTFAYGALGCTEECPLMCLEITYNKQFSYGVWPSDVVLTAEMICPTSTANLVSLRSESLYEAFNTMSMEQEASWLKRNTLKLSIYFNQLQFSTIKTSNSYTIVNLLSDQGGQVGLWLGLSILTLFEVVELVWDLTKVIASHFMNRNQQANGAVVEMSVGTNDSNGIKT